MSKSAIERERQNLTALRSERESKFKSMEIQVLKNQIVIDDHSQNDDYRLVLTLLSVMGVNIEIQTESPCG